MPKLDVVLTNKYKKDLIRCIKRGYDRNLLNTVIIVIPVKMGI